MPGQGGELGVVAQLFLKGVFEELIDGLRGGTQRQRRDEDGKTANHSAILPDAPSFGSQRTSGTPRR